jgi:hypothetical protein
MEFSVCESFKLLGFGLFSGGGFLLEGVGLEFRVLNVYGLYVVRAPFWETLLKKQLLKVENLILGGDLNFSLGEAEFWGPTAHPDPQSGIFSHLLMDHGLIDISPLKLLPTWRNMRMGEAE